MPERGRHLPLLRVLAAVAWADGELAGEEEAFLRGLMDDLDLSTEGRAEVEGLLTAPVSRDAFDRYAREFEAKIDDAGLRSELLAAVERLVAIDRTRAVEETEYLNHLRDWLSAADAGSGSGGASFWNRLRGGVQSTWKRAASMKDEVFGPSAWASRLGEAVTSRLQPGAEASALQGPRRDYVTLFGALLQRVVDADGVTHPNERAALLATLSGRFGLSSAEVDYVLRLVGDHVASGADRQRLCAEFNRISGPEQRIDLLRALFAAALADGEISRPEEDEVHLIANFLWIERQDYAAIRRESLAHRQAEA